LNKLRLFDEKNEEFDIEDLGLSENDIVRFYNRRRFHCFLRLRHSRDGRLFLGGRRFRFCRFVSSPEPTSPPEQPAETPA